MKLEFRARDFEYVSANEQVWENELAWARKDLVERGLMRKNSPKDHWEISDKGRQWLKDRPTPPKLDDPMELPDEFG